MEYNRSIDRMQNIGILRISKGKPAEIEKFVERIVNQP